MVGARATKRGAAPLSSRLIGLFTDPKSLRTWSLAAKDGIIATAGILLGFAGAGASDRTLLIAATAATVAGMIGAGGAEWSLAAAERESQLFALEEEKIESRTQPGVEFLEIVAHYRDKGLSADLAVEVAEQLMVHSPLRAQLEAEHGISRLMTQIEVWWAGIGVSMAFGLGAAIPFAITYFLPVSVETWVIVVAVLISLVLISVAGAWAGNMSLGRTLWRNLIVGIATIVVSYAVGQIAF